LTATSECQTPMLESTYKQTKGKLMTDYKTLDLLVQTIQDTGRAFTREGAMAYALGMLSVNVPQEVTERLIAGLHEGV